MISSSLRRRASFLLVGAFLLVPWASAAEPLDRGELRSVLSRLWNSLTGVWAQTGCGIDPYGGACLTGTPGSPDEGCTIDPYGRCLPAPTTDDGCSADPFGGCRSGS
jgi:hypothetical protein